MHLYFVVPVTKLCPTLWNPMDCSTAVFPILHYPQNLLKFMSIESVIHVTISSSASPPPFAFSHPQYQGLFQWVGFSHQMAKLLELQFQHQSFQWIFRVDFFSDLLVWSPCCPGDSQESSPAPQSKIINSSLLSLHYGLCLTSIHDYWKNYNYANFCRWCLCFLICCLGFS